MLFWLVFICCLVILFGGLFLLLALLAIWKIVLGLLLAVVGWRTFMPPRRPRGTLWR